MATKLSKKPSRKKGGSLTTGAFIVGDTEEVDKAIKLGKQPGSKKGVETVNRVPIRGMVDCEGNQVCEDDIVEFHHWCYASCGRSGEEEPPKPYYGVVRWNTLYFTYEPVISATDDYNGNCFAYVCTYKPAETVQGSQNNKVFYPATYFKVIGNIYDNPELLERLPMTQEVGE